MTTPYRRSMYFRRYGHPIATFKVSIFHTGFSLIFKSIQQLYFLMLRNIKFRFNFITCQLENRRRKVFVSWKHCRHFAQTALTDGNKIVTSLQNNLKIRCVVCVCMWVHFLVPHLWSEWQKKISSRGTTWHACHRLATKILLNNVGAAR
jgi:hypothetical protein